MKNTRLQQFNQAAEIYVERTKAHPDVIGIVLAGTYISGLIDKHSDVDVVVLLDKNCAYRERGNTWINEVEIEYFMNPPQQIRQYFRNEYKTAHMLVNGKIAYQKSSEILDLVEEAKQLLQTKPATIQPFEKELGKYFIDDLYKDLEDAKENEDLFAFQLVKNNFIDRCINLFCKVHHLRRDKAKRLKKQLATQHPQFAKVLESCLSTCSFELQHLKELRIMIEDLIGGSRPKEWVFRSPLDL